MTQPTRAVEIGPYAYITRCGSPCARPCATHNCSRPCGRIYGHPQDSVRCICGGCASAMAGVAI